MSIDAYADIPDLYVHGLPPALLVAQPRPLESIDVGTGTFRLGGAGLADDDPLQFISMGGLVPAGLSASAVYYAIPVPDSESLFQVAASVGGLPVTITTAGTGVVAVVPSLLAKARAALIFRARWIDEHLVAHSVPLVAPYPVDVVAMNAILASADLMRTIGLGNPEYAQSAQPIFDAANQVQLRLNRLADGVPLRGAVTDRTPTIAEAGARAWGECDRGWSPKDAEGNRIL